MSAAAPTELPTVRFFWVGPPRYDKGGHDVVGISSLHEARKAQSADEPKNPLEFWCLNEHVAAYKQYFNDQGIVCKVIGIESHLEADCKSTDPYICEKAPIVLDNLHSLLSSDPQTIDRVYCKDMLFAYLMATQSGYVLDTNIQAAPGQRLNLKSFDTFHFPTFLDNEGGAGEEMSADVWMQYSPASNCERARQSLNWYLRHFPEALQLRGTGEAYHLAEGSLVVNALLCQTTHNDMIRHAANRWQGIRKYSHYVLIEELGIRKEYINSHKFYAGSAPNAIQGHVLLGDISALMTDLRFGADPNFTSTLCSKSLDGEQISLLNIAAKYLWFVADASDRDMYQFVKCIEILLKRGADANAVCKMRFPAMKRPAEQKTKAYSVLTQILELGRRFSSGASYKPEAKVQVDAGLKLILAARPDLATILNNETPLMVAVRTDFGVEALLEAKADPNQDWTERTHSPLTMAIEYASAHLVALLLQHGADPNLEARQTPQLGDVRILCETPLHMAARLNQPKIVALLLQNPRTNVEIPAVYSQPDGEETLSTVVDQAAVHPGVLAVFRAHGKPDTAPSAFLPPAPKSPSLPAASQGP